MKKLRFHVASLPHTQTTKEYLSCAYTQKVIKFCQMMKGLGHEVYLYAGEENEAPCDKLIPCTPRMSIKDYTSFPFDPANETWKKMNQEAIRGIQANKQPKDFICLIAGLCQKEIADAHPDLLSVEFGIGYGGVFANFRVFESYAWMHTVYGNLYGTHSADGRFYDTVIPNYFDPDDFPFSEEKEDYYLYIGRLTDRKGVKIAVEACERAGKKLVVAGGGTPPDNVDYRGVVGMKERGELLSKAQAVFTPTLYIEPFGGAAVEAMLCGTPVISTDWGAFTETVKQGITGYRCRTLQEFVTAMEEVKKLDYMKIRYYAMKRFSLDIVQLKYQEYFTRLYDLWDKGWYT